MARIGGNQFNSNRHPTDLYPTHPAWTEALLNTVKFSGPILEPACGNGDMVTVLERYGHRVTATDILTGEDFLSRTEPWAGDIITNPPYRFMDQFVDKATKLASGKVAMLMPVGALGGQRRFKNTWSVVVPELVLVVASRMPINGVASQFNHVWVVFNGTGRTTTEIKWSL